MPPDPNRNYSSCKRHGSKCPYAPEHAPICRGSFRFKKRAGQNPAVQAPPLWKIWLERPSSRLMICSADVLRIKRLYQDRGFYSAAVEYQTQSAEENMPSRRPYRRNLHHQRRTGRFGSNPSTSRSARNPKTDGKDLLAPFPENRTNI